MSSCPCRSRLSVLLRRPLATASARRAASHRILAANAVSGSYATPAAPSFLGALALATQSPPSDRLHPCSQHLRPLPPAHLVQTPPAAGALLGGTRARDHQCCLLRRCCPGRSVSTLQTLAACRPRGSTPTSSQRDNAKSHISAKSRFCMPPRRIGVTCGEICWARAASTSIGGLRTRGRLPGPATTPSNTSSGRCRTC